jgi:GntR family transcriptional regulator
VRTFRYQEIAESVRERIDRGEYSAGQVLPSEASLGEIYRASRVTIRKALERLRADGLVESRQGFGWVVAAEPFAQSLDELVTIEQQLADGDITVEREIVDFAFVETPPSVAPLLGARALEVRRVNRADGEPFARVTVWCREDLGVELSRAQVARSSFYDLLPGPKRATQTIGAELMAESDAELLDVPALSAALIVRRTTFGDGDRVILVSELVFPGHLTEFVAELARPSERADGDGALRLVEGG